MKARQLIIIGAIVLLVGGVLTMNFIASMKKSPERKAPPPAIRSAEYVLVKNGTIRAKIPVTGKLDAKDKIEIYAEVTGNLLPSSTRFKAGNEFAQSATLISIDDSELRLSLQSGKSNFLSVLTRILPDLKLDYPEAYAAWNNYTDAFTVTGALKPLPEIKGKEKYYLSSQGVLNQYYSIKSQEARLAKYTIQAPFTGTVSMAGIKPGTLVRAGQKLGEFINTKTFEIEVSIDLNHLPFAQVGAEVLLSSNQVEGQFVGKVSRISDALDPATQSAKIIVELSEPSLKDGMYLHGYILTKEFENAVALSKAQITEKNTGFLIENGRLKEVPLSPLFVGENEIITAQLKNGDKVLRTLFMGAVNGTRVAVEGDENATSKNGGKKPTEAQEEAE